MVYRPTIPPAGLDADGLRRWTEDEFRQMSQGLTNFDLLQLNKIVAPAGPLPGMLAYADGVTWNPGAGEGVYERVAAGWRRLFEGTPPPPERPEIPFNYAPCNAGFNLWQRGATVPVAATTNSYTADRWNMTTGATQAHTISRQAGMGASQFCARIQRDAGQTGTSTVWFECPLDAEEVIALRGKKIAMSLLMRAGANFSATNVQIALIYGTGATPGRVSTTAYTGQTNALLQNCGVLTGAATRYQGDAGSVIPANATQATIFITWVPIGTAGAADYFEVGEVSLLDITNGTFPGVFVPLPLELDLAIAMRMYETNMPTISTAPGQNVAGGVTCGAAINTTQVLTQGVRYASKKRAVPTITFYAPSNAITGVVGTAGRWQNVVGGIYVDSTAATAQHTTSIDHFSMLITGAFTVLGAYYSIGGWVANASLP